MNAFPRFDGLTKPRRDDRTRTEALLSAAARVFLRHGFECARIVKVAAESGMSSRTIYERFRNKADLFRAVVLSDTFCGLEPILSAAAIETLDPVPALTLAGEVILGQLLESTSISVYRIVVTESELFPDLAVLVRHRTRCLFEKLITNYLRFQSSIGVLDVPEPDKAATLFFYMITAELREHVQFNTRNEISSSYCKAHVDRAVGIFVGGCVKRLSPNSTVACQHLT
jgi:AcrR family transcriptional regulator